MTHWPKKTGADWKSAGSAKKTTSIACLPVAPGQLAVVPPAGGRGVLQVAQFDGHLLQGSSLRFTLTGDQLSLEDTEEDIQASNTRCGFVLSCSNQSEADESDPPTQTS